MTRRDPPLEALRHALDAIPEEVAHHGTEPPPPKTVYVVPGHESALNPDVVLVVGDRGTGKSFWSAALNGETTRTLIGRQMRRLGLDRVHVAWGYSSAIDNRQHPSRRVLRDLLIQRFEPEEIWRTVILWQLTERFDHPYFESTASWAERTTRLRENVEAGEQLLFEFNRRLHERGERYLVVFDALDRLGGDWGQIRKLLNGLLRVALELREYRTIRIKLFLRPDMWEDKRVWSFPDSSKLTHNAVVLEWRRADLYGLFWHHLGNDEQSGCAFRNWVEHTHGERFEMIEISGERVHVLPERLRTREDVQEALLNAIASPFMGQNRRRGKTYSWLPTHLADAKGQISPRSFLLALKEAYLATERQNTGGSVLLHYEGIKRGVQKASSIRLRELREDYPWIDQILEPLQGITVPVTVAELRARWREAAVVEKIRSQAGAQGMDDEAGPELPPHALDAVPEGQSKEDSLLEAAIEIGMMRRAVDGRINIPDLFRVAAGIGRRGGVPPIR